MSSVEEQVADLKSRLSRAQQERMRKEVERDQAQMALDKARTVLKDEFGVTTDEEAQEALKRLEGELAALVTRIEEELEQTSDAD